MNWKIVHNKDHYNVYINGKFYCSADTFEEAVKELEEYEVAIFRSKYEQCI